MAGSKRVNIVGHTIVLHPHEAQALRRLPNDTLLRHFREAQETGQSLLVLGAFSYALHRLPDHTFRLERQSDEHRLPI